MRRLKDDDKKLFVANNMLIMQADQSYGMIEDQCVKSECKVSGRLYKV